MSPLLVFGIASVTWIVWLPACSLQQMARGRSGSVTILPEIPVFPLVAWGLAYLFYRLSLPVGVALVGIAHLLLLVAFLLSIVKSKVLLRRSKRD